MYGEEIPATVRIGHRWYVSVFAVVLPVAVGASYVREPRNEPLAGIGLAVLYRLHEKT